MSSAVSEKRSPYFAGLDIGSLTTETVILDNRGEMVCFDIIPTGANGRLAGERSLRHGLEKAELSLDDLHGIVATGYGRISAEWATRAVTEITCHARGAFALFPETRTIIDIGGQDSKVIKLEKNGRVADFIMNDKCAAGTGRFLEVMARALEIDLEQMGTLSLQAVEEISVSNMCTVFAESEVISLVALGKPIADIIGGIHNAITGRIVAMVDRLGLVPAVTMTGGVAKNRGLVAQIEKKLNVRINLPREPQIVGALGAALIAAGREDGFSQG